MFGETEIQMYYVDSIKRKPWFMTMRNIKEVIKRGTMLSLSTEVQGLNKGGWWGGRILRPPRVAESK